MLSPGSLMSIVVVTMLLTVAAPKEMDANLLATAARNAVLALLPKPENGDAAKHPYDAEVKFVGIRAKEEGV
jgi:hypothetical protein